MSSRSSVIDQGKALALNPREMLGLVTKFFCTPIGIGHMINTLYGIGFTLQCAMLPFLVLDLRLPVIYNGYVLGLFAFMQFSGAIVFGRVADWLGPKLAFMVALGCSTANYTLMAVSIYPWMLFISQLPGFLMHGFQSSAFLICLETDQESRTPALAYLSLSYGLGMTLGGILGGLLGYYIGGRGALLVAAALTVLGCYFATKLEQFDELHTHAGHPRTPRDIYQQFRSEALRLYRVIQKAQSMCFLLIFGLFPILITRFALTPVAVDLFGLNPSESSYLVAYIGIITVFAEGLLAPPLARKFGDMTCNKYSIIIAAVGFLALIAVGSHEFLIISLLIIPLCGGALLYVCATAQMTKRVEQAEFGSVLGVNSAIFFMVAGIAGIVGLFFYVSFGIRAMWGVCLLWNALLATYIFGLGGKGLTDGGLASARPQHE